MVAIRMRQEGPVAAQDFREGDRSAVIGEALKSAF